MAARQDEHNDGPPASAPGSPFEALVNCVMGGLCCDEHGCDCDEGTGDECRDMHDHRQGDTSEERCLALPARRVGHKDSGQHKKVLIAAVSQCQCVKSGGEVLQWSTLSLPSESPRVSITGFELIKLTVVGGEKQRRKNT